MSVHAVIIKAVDAARSQPAIPHLFFMPPQQSHSRTSQQILFSGPFGAAQVEWSRDEVCARLKCGARDVLYLVPNGAAKRSVVQALVQRRCTIFGVHVVTMASLPREIDRRARVHSGRLLDGLAEKLITERAIRKACGSAFQASVPIDGLARDLASAIEALEVCGATPAELAEELSGTDNSGGASLLLDAWCAVTELRSGLGRTRPEVMANALRHLRTHPEVLAGCDILVLENVSLDSASNRELLAGLIAAAPGHVIAAYEAPVQLPDTSASRTLATLRRLAAWEERVCVPEDTVFQRAIDRVFTTGIPDRPAYELPAGPEVCLLEAAGDAGEVRLAAGVVRRHLRAGTPPEEIQIVLRSPGQHARLIEDIFTTAGIPVAIARTRPVADTEIGDVLVRLLRAALHPDACGMRESLALLRTAHVDLAGAQADHFERWVRTRGLLGFATWTELDPAALDERTCERAGRFRDALFTAHAGFNALETAADAAAIARRLARELRLVGNAYFARMRTLRHGGNDPALRSVLEPVIREDNQAWEEIEEVLDRMPELLHLAGTPAYLSGAVLAERWLSILGTAFRSVSAGARVPASGAVRVVGVAGACTRPARVTLVLGLLEKAFPRQVRQDPFLHDALRRSLRERRGWHLPGTEEHAEQEREWFLRAISSAREVLYLSCAATDGEGKPALRSFFLQDLERVHHIRRAERLGTSDVVLPVEDSANPADLLAALAHDAWQHLPAAPTFQRRRANAFFAHDELARRGVLLDVVRGERRHDHPPVLDASLLEGTPHHTLRLSASQLRSIAHCTYRHYVDTVLAPSTLDEPAYDALSRGSLIHDAIMEWATGFGGWERGEAALEETDRWVQGRVAAWPPSMRRNAAAQHAADANRRRLQDFLRQELALTEHGGARPMYTELAFGEQADGAGRRDPASIADAYPFPIDTPDGKRTVYFRGSIDRVDVFQEGNQLYGVAIDYKTGRTSKHYAKEMWNGHDLQLRLYLLALEHFWGIVPVGALYLGFGDGVRRGTIQKDFEPWIPGLGPSSEVKRLESEDWHQFVYPGTRERITALVDRLIRRDIVAVPHQNDCGFCTHASICRFERFAAEEIGV